VSTPTLIIPSGEESLSLDVFLEGLLFVEEIEHKMPQCTEILRRLSATDTTFVFTESDIKRPV